eukprot:g8545.t1
MPFREAEKQIRDIWGKVMRIVNQDDEERAAICRKAWNGTAWLHPRENQMRKRVGDRFGECGGGVRRVRLHGKSGIPVQPHPSYAWGADDVACSV